MSFFVLLGKHLLEQNRAKHIGVIIKQYLPQCASKATIGTYLLTLSLAAGGFFNKGVTNVKTG